MTPLNIVLAEDNDDHAEMIVDTLEDVNQKNKVTRFSNGQKLMDYLLSLYAHSTMNTERPDLILLDIKMPILDGLKTLKLLKETENFKKIPIIMISTSDYDDDIEKSYEYGASSYIVKPFSYEDFHKKIQHINQFWADICELPKK